jgi:excisionase family DNA binding protein
MYNPFEPLDARLSVIEEALLDLRAAFRKQYGAQQTESNHVGRTLNIQQAAEFVGLTKQTVYRKTSANEIPHFKKSGRVFFDRQELDGWLKSNRVPTKTELQKQAGEHMADRARRPR